MKRLILTLAGLGLLLISGGCGCRNGNCKENVNDVTKPRPQPVALIFCDVTNSLTREENKKVGDIAADILDKLPRGAIFKLYPIQIQTQTLPHIHIDINGDKNVDEEDYQVVPEPPDSTKVKEYDERLANQRAKWRELIQKEVDGFYERLSRGPERTPDNRTCILNALSFASNYVSTNYGDAEKYDVRMFLISDMVEECNDTPLRGGRVDMDKRDISAEIQRAGTFQAEDPQTGNSRPDAPRPKCDLRRVAIYCVFPAASDTPTVSSARRPNRDDVKTFWGEIFKRCGGQDGQPGGQVTWVDSGDLTELLKNLWPAAR